jgi:hypothetical protein
MRQIARLCVFCFILILVLNAGAAFGESPSERNCAGDFERIGGQVFCTVVDPVGNSENSGGKSQTTTDEESSNGTFNNTPKHAESCTGPGGSGEDGGPCHSK